MRTKLTRRLGVSREVETAIEFVRRLEGTGDEWFRCQEPECQWAIVDELEEVLAVIDLAIVDLRGDARHLR